MKLGKRLPDIHIYIDIYVLPAATPKILIPQKTGNVEHFSGRMRPKIHSIWGRIPGRGQTGQFKMAAQIFGKGVPPGRGMEGAYWGYGVVLLSLTVTVAIH